MTEYTDLELKTLFPDRPYMWDSAVKKLLNDGMDYRDLRSCPSCNKFTLRQSARCDWCDECGYCEGY